MHDNDASWVTSSHASCYAAVVAVFSFTFTTEGKKNVLSHWIKETFVDDEWRVKQQKLLKWEAKDS